MRDVDPTTSTTELFFLYYDKGTGEITYDDTNTRRQLFEEGARTDGDEATIKVLQERIGAQEERIGAQDARIRAWRRKSRRSCSAKRTGSSVGRLESLDAFSFLFKSRSHLSEDTCKLPSG